MATVQEQFVVIGFSSQNTMAAFGPYSDEQDATTARHSLERVNPDLDWVVTPLRGRAVKKLGDTVEEYG